MKKTDQLKSRLDNPLRIISLNLEHLNICLELDEITLNGFWTKKQWHKELSDPKRMAIGLFQKNDLLAFVSGWLICDEIHVVTMAVHPQHRRNGLGQLLLSTLLNQAQLKGIKKATLEVSNKNFSAIALYSKLGFKVKGYRSKYYRDNSAALILWYSLE